MSTNTTELTLSDDLKISEIQEQFNGIFSQLKLEFFSKAHEDGEGSHKNDMISPELTLGSVRNNHTEGSLKVAPDMSVSSLEEAFETNYGLHVQVFRKSGDVWLETTVTDSWTLEEQNNRSLEREH